MKSPRFKHDCKQCIFLGRFESLDLYYCRVPETHHACVLSRYGDEGSMYESGRSSFYNPKTDCFPDYHPGLTEAYLRARNLKEFVE